MTLSITRRLIWWLAVPLTLLFLCGVLANYYINVAPVIAGSERRLSSAVHLLSERVQVAGDQVVFTQSTPGETAALEDDSIKYVVRDAQQRVLGGDARLPHIEIPRTAREVRSVVQVKGRDLRMLASRVDTRAGPITITAAEFLPASQPTTRVSFISTVLLDFLQLDLTLVLVWIGVQVGLRPLKQLRDEIESRSPQDLRLILDSAVPHEIAPLTATVNRLLGALSGSIHAQQQFIANAAHQLRTPITGLIAQLDLLATDPAAEPVRNRLATAQNGIRQLAHSVNQLLMLARADSAAARIVKNVPVDLKSVVEEVVTKFVDRAVAAGIDLGVETQSAWLKADPALLDDLLSNLIDNALKYTSSGGTVTVSAGLEDEQPFLEVDDNGIGIPESERQRVRLRFYRSPNSPGYGSGLGLSIVDEIARLHGAALSIDAGSSGRGTRIRVQFSSVRTPDAV